MVAPAHLSDWIIKLVDYCYAKDFSVSLAALSILQDLAEFHKEIHAMEPVLITRIIMTLGVFAQQQVEDASVEVESAMENAIPTAGRGTFDSVNQTSIVDAEPSMPLRRGSSGYVNDNLLDSPVVDSMPPGSAKIALGHPLTPQMPQGPLSARSGGEIPSFAPYCAKDCRDF